MIKSIRPLTLAEREAINSALGEYIERHKSEKKGFGAWAQTIVRDEMLNNLLFLEETAPVRASSTESEQVQK